MGTTVTGAIDTLKRGSGVQRTYELLYSQSELLVGGFTLNKAYSGYDYLELNCTNTQSNYGRTTIWSKQMLDFVYNAQGGGSKLLYANLNDVSTSYRIQFCIDSDKKTFRQSSGSGVVVRNVYGIRYA